MIEPLENRMLLAATFTNGVLNVTGATGNDSINVRLDGASLVLSFNTVETRYKLIDVHEILMNGGDGNDVLANHTSITSHLTGGNGNDKLSGGNAKDTLLGSAGIDKLYGEGGNDVLDPGAGNDTVVGGIGLDTVTYSKRKVPVKIYLNGLASGAVGEADIIAGVENARGGLANDSLYGDANPNALYGGAGNDLINGGNGKDSLFGQAGNDKFIANDGDTDTIVAGDGADSARLDPTGDTSDAETVLA
jgi:Ca2+-binding RTX toxin-like protein